MNEKEAVDGYSPLHFGCLSNDLAAVAMLIDFHADTSLLGHDGWSCLHVSAGKGSTNVLKYLLKHCPKHVINTTDLKRMTPLHMACISGSADTVRLLLDAGADPNILDETGHSALLRAAEQGACSVVRQLLKRDGVEVDACNQDGMSPVYSASRRGHITVVRALIRAGADVNKSSADCFSPLHVASQQGFVEVVKELLAAGAQLDHSNGVGQTALHAASDQGYVEVVSQLISAGADVHKRDTKGMSALYMAANASQCDVMRELLRAGADVNQAEGDGGTPLMQVKDLPCVRMLLNAGANPTATDALGCNALYYASRRGNLDVLMELLSAGADVRNCDEEGLSALHVSAEGGHCDVARELLRAGADVNKVDDEGVTPIMRALNVPCVRLLLDAGAIPTLTDTFGYNALHHSGVNASPAGVICCLVKAGCDPRALTGDGKTPADVARDEGEAGTAELLDRLAQDALKKSSKSSADGSASKVVQEGKAEGSGLQKEPAKGLSASKEKDEIVGNSRRVKPCGHCGAMTHRKCAGCRVTHYCSLGCQRATYAEHMEACAALRDEKMEAKAQRAAAKANRRETAREGGS